MFTEPADLGAFTSVFRVMSQLQAFQEPVIVNSRPESRGLISVSETESDSSRWSHQIIDSYLEHDHGSPYSPPHSHSPAVISDLEADEDDGSKARDSDSSDTEGVYENGLDEDVSAPTLGALDSALGFMAAESAKLAAALEVRNTTWMNPEEPRKRRRRKRRGPSKAASVLDHDEAPPSVTVVPTPEASSSSSAESSSPYKTGLSPPDSESALSRPRDTFSRRQLSPHPFGSKSSSHSHQDLYISSSLPNLSRPLPLMVDSRLARLRVLAQKLRHHFPQNSMSLRQVLIDDLPENSRIDPRGPEVQPGDPLVHVFIDQ